MGVDFSEQKNGLEKKFHRHPSEDAEAEGGRLVKEADFEAEIFFYQKN